jgi:hypothetical protein
MLSPPEEGREPIAKIWLYIKQELITFGMTQPTQITIPPVILQGWKNMFTELLHNNHMDGGARASACGERYMDRFEGVGLHSPFLELDLDCEEMGLKFLGGYGGITVRG